MGRHVRPVVTEFPDCVAALMRIGLRGEGHYRSGSLDGIDSWDASGSVGVSSMIDVEHVDDAFGFVDAIPDSVFAPPSAPLTCERRT